MLSSHQKCDIMLPVKGRWVACPTCGRNAHMKQIRPDTYSRNDVIFCRICKTEYIVDIDEGKCYLSRGQ